MPPAHHTTTKYSRVFPNSGSSEKSWSRPTVLHAAVMLSGLICRWRDATVRRQPYWAVRCLVQPKRVCLCLSFVPIFFPPMASRSWISYLRLEPAHGSSGFHSQRVYVRCSQTEPSPHLSLDCSGNIVLLGYREPVERGDLKSKNCTFHMISSARNAIFSTYSSDIIEMCEFHSISGQPRLSDWLNFGTLGPFCRSSYPLILSIL